MAKQPDIKPAGIAKQNENVVRMSAFRESRIYAEGWNAARKSAKPSDNPYTSEPERSRWLLGYTEGQA